MDTLKKSSVAAATLAILIAGLVLTQPKTMQGDPLKDVRIVNTPAEAIPTKVQGTVSVAGAVSGTVQAEQSGPWTVGISGSPSVGIDPNRNIVKLAAESRGTKLLLYDDYNGMPTGTGAHIDPIDISPYSKVRVSGVVNGSGSVKFWVHAGRIVGGPNQGLSYIDDFSSNSHFTKLYEVAGVALHIHMIPSDSNNQAILTIFGN